jgi:subtilisin-like proprotein convertase family protein
MVPRQGQPIRFLEHVTATVALNYTERRGLIEINLISPSGLTSPLLTLSLYDNFATENELSWTFKSVHFWGENPTGNWRFQFRSVAKVAVGKIWFTCNNLMI